MVAQAMAPTRYNALLNGTLIKSLQVMIVTLDWVAQNLFSVPPRNKLELGLFKLKGAFAHRKRASLKRK